MRKNILPIVILTVVLILWGLYKIFSFDFFTEKPEKIKEIEVPNKDYTIDLYYMPPNATTEDNIQLRLSNNSSEIVKVYPQYNFVDDYKLANDTLILVLSDTHMVNIKKILFMYVYHNTHLLLAG